MAGDIDALIVALMVVALWLIVRWHRRSQPHVDRPAATIQRLLKARTPDDCSACRRHPSRSPSASAALPPPRPWCTLKSRRGAPKRIPTEGFACPNHTCLYHGITDAQVHALVGAGIHGKRERIQTLRCQACGATFTSRRDTPLYRLKTPTLRVVEVLSALAEGLSIAAAARVFGHSEGTITT